VSDSKQDERERELIKDVLDLTSNALMEGQKSMRKDEERERRRRERKKEEKWSLNTWEACNRVK
jgi:hypothetical protein